jgi:hypothetical protein
MTGPEPPVPYSDKALRQSGISGSDFDSAVATIEMISGDDKSGVLFAHLQLGPYPGHKCNKKF